MDYMKDMVDTFHPKIMKPFCYEHPKPKSHLPKENIPHLPPELWVMIATMSLQHVLGAYDITNLFSSCTALRKLLFSDAILFYVYSLMSLRYQLSCFLHRAEDMSEEERIDEFYDIIELYSKLPNPSDSVLNFHLKDLKHQLTLAIHSSAGEILTYTQAHPGWCINTETHHKIRRIADVFDLDVSEYEVDVCRDARQLLEWKCVVMYTIVFVVVCICGVLYFTKAPNATDQLFIAQPPCFESLSSYYYRYPHGVGEYCRDGVCYKGDWKDWILAFVKDGNLNETFWWHTFTREYTLVNASTTVLHLSREYICNLILSHDAVVCGRIATVGYEYVLYVKRATKTCIFENYVAGWKNSRDIYGATCFCLVVMLAYLWVRLVRRKYKI